MPERDSHIFGPGVGPIPDELREDGSGFQANKPSDETDNISDKRISDSRVILDEDSLHGEDYEFEGDF